MKKNIIAILFIVLTLGLFITGCSSSDDGTTDNANTDLGSDSSVDTGDSSNGSSDLDSGSNEVASDDEVDEVLEDDFDDEDVEIGSLI